MRSNVTKGRILIRLISLTALLSLVLTKAFAVETEKEETLHKAKIMKTIIEMVGWPANSIPKDNFSICVMGNDPFMKQIDSLNGTTISDHKVAVKKITKVDEPKNSCNLVYLYDQTTDVQDNVIKAYAKKPVLLLGDMDSFALRGGSMNFTHLNGTLAITVNMESMKNSNLYIDLKSVDRITVIPQAKDLQ